MKAVITWTKSVSLDVVSQNLVILLNDAPGIDEMLTPEVESRELEVEEGTNVKVSHKCFNGKKWSREVTAEATAPVIAEPEPASNLAISFTE